MVFQESSINEPVLKNIANWSAVILNAYLIYLVGLGLLKRGFGLLYIYL